MAHIVPDVTMSSAGNDNDGGHQATQLAPIHSGWDLAPGVRDVDTRVLTLSFERHYRYDTYNSFSSKDFGVRMTSVYDPIRDSTGQTDINPGTGNQFHRPIATESTDAISDAGLVDFYKFYASLYDWYSVMGCRYRIGIENLSHEMFYVHKMFYNNKSPDPKASAFNMRKWPGAQTKIVHPKMIFGNSFRVYQDEGGDYNVEDNDMIAATTTNASGTITGYTSNPIGSSMVYFTGEYRPGMYKREVHNEQDQEIYTAINTNPVFPEVLLLRISKYDHATPPSTGGDGNNYNRPFTFKITCELEYLVQFRELKEGIYRPINNNPITVHIATDAEDGL